MNYLKEYADDRKLPILDTQTFNRLTKEHGKEKFREDVDVPEEEDREGEK